MSVPSNCLLPLELGVAAAVGKQLLETNLTLRQRHASIVSKTSPMPPTLSPLMMNSPTPADALSPPMTPIASPSVYHRTPGTTGSSRHSRRLSTTPAQLSMLNKQNEELLAALANIQDETAAADLEGKQKLRKLEKEIAGLRSELESSHEKNNELESKIDTVQADQEHQRQRSRDLDVASTSGSKTITAENEERSQSPFSFPNFAPLSTTPLKKAFERQAMEESAEPNLVAFPSSDPAESQPSAEYLLLSKLLAKIEELESTNRQILARHRETDSRLRNATNRSDALQKVYATLEDEMENDTLHMDADDEYEEGLLSPNMGLSLGQYDSFRGNLRSEPSGMQALGVVFEPPEEEREPSLRDRGSPIPSIHRTDSGLTPMVSASESLRLRRSRKALSSRLFESTAEDSSPTFGTSDLQGGEYDHDQEEEMAFQKESSHFAGKASTSRSGLRPKPSTHSIGGAKRRLRPKASLDGRQFTSSLAPRRAIRPSASYQGLREQSPRTGAFKPKGDTLWNEIKALADDDLIASQDSEDAEAIERTIDSILLEHNGHLPTRPHEDVSLEQDEDEVPNVQEPGDGENRAVAAIRDALDPRNIGRPLNEDEHILPVGSLEGSPGESFFLISHAVAARPTKWTKPHPSSTPYLDAAARHRKRIEPAEEKRQNPRADSLYGVDGGGRMIGRRADALERLNEAAQGRTGPTRGRSRRGTRRSDGIIDENQDEHQGTVVRAGKRRRDDPAAQEGWGQTLLELWIILQVSTMQPISGQASNVP